MRKWHFEVPGYPWKDSLSPSHPQYPTGAEVQAYLQSYARDAGLLPLTHFGAEVQSLKPVPPANGDSATVGSPGSRGWEVEWSDSARCPSAVCSTKRHTAHLIRKWGG